MASELRRRTRKIKRKIQAILFILAFSVGIIIYGYETYFESPIAGPRRRLASTDIDDDYYINSLEEFPPLLFSYDQIKNGAWVLNFFGMLYCFIGISIICDDYFVPTVEIIAERLNMSEDTAGATWLAAGGSAPELFTSFVGTFIAESDVGFGTIVGSAVFNVLFIIGACAIFTAGDLKLQWWPFARDMSYYLFCLSILGMTNSYIRDHYHTHSLSSTSALFFGGVSQNEMYWWESLILLCLYFLYVLLMKYNEKIKAAFFRRFVVQNSQNEQELLSKKDGYGTTEISMQKQQDKIDNKQSKPITYLAVPDDSLTGQVRTSSVRSRNGTGSLRSGSYISRKGKSFVAEPNEQEPDGDDEEDEEEGGIDLSWPQRTRDRIWYIIKLPLTLPIYCTLFDVTKQENEAWWPWTFIGSLVWLGGLAYLMVWWCVVVGFAWNVPQEIMGLVFLAAGTSVPEMFSCIIVAKKGKADMAVSASIGSNIFDILVGLPLPWLCFALTQSDFAGDIKIDVQAHGLFLSILVLIAILGCLLVLILVNKWVLTHCMGYCMIGLYLFFIIQDLARYYWLDIEF